jgi:hypothetical protein
MKNNVGILASNTTADCIPGVLQRETETLCSDAIERIARVLGLSVDLDDPEQALVAAVESRIVALVERKWVKKRHPYRRERSGLGR